MHVEVHEEVPSEIFIIDKESVGIKITQGTQQVTDQLFGKSKHKDVTVAVVAYLFYDNAISFDVVAINRFKHMRQTLASAGEAS